MTGFPNRKTVERLREQFKPGITVVRSFIERITVMDCTLVLNSNPALRLKSQHKQTQRYGSHQAKMVAAFFRFEVEKFTI